MYTSRRLSDWDLKKAILSNYGSRCLDTEFMRFVRYFYVGNILTELQYFPWILSAKFEYYKNQESSEP